MANEWKHYVGYKLKVITLILFVNDHLSFLSF